MLTQIMTLTRNALKDWFVQRVTAVILACYVLLIFGYLLGHHPLQYPDWSTLFHYNSMRAFTVLAVLSLAAHSWVGVWTVFTDYISCRFLRGILMTFVVVLLIVYVVWTITILWS